MKSRFVFNGDFTTKVYIELERKHYDKVFLLTDSRVNALYGVCVKRMLKKYDLNYIIIPEGDDNKSIYSLQYIWKHLSDNGATRHSCLINFGGGMITDLGGFAAATFKRGIDFINIPTTILSIVDASSGGKTAINFNGLKNEVGTFAVPVAVILHKAFIVTLGIKDVLSGYAEMLKHSLLDSERMWSEIITYDLTNRSTFQFADMLRDSMMVKERIVEKDPYEQGLRKILNFGHTFGHAFEEISYEKGSTLSHGYAVAYGIVCELYLSCVLQGFPTDKMRQTVQFIHNKYGTIDITCKDYDRLLELMHHDKKNSDGVINFALLKDFGNYAIDCHATKDDILEALDFLREGL